MTYLPITAKLIPKNARNLTYLAEIAALTRLIYGAVRVYQNKPEKLHDPKLSQNQKRQAFLERFFVEIIGTAGYIGTLHLGQDLFSKLFEKRIQNLPSIAEDVKGLSKDEILKANEAIRDVFGPHQKDATHLGKGMIYRVLYGDEFKREGKVIVQKSNLTTLRQKLGDDLFRKVRAYAPEIDAFASRMNRYASLSIVGGVLLSALYGGLVTQWLNDRLIAPLTGKYLKKRYANDESKPKSIETPAPPQRLYQQAMPPQTPAAMPVQATMATPGTGYYGRPATAPYSPPALSTVGGSM